MYASKNFHPPCTEYDCDILETLKERESRRWKATLTLPQIERRNAAVELIRNIAEEHSFQRTSVHLAVYMLDLFMSHNNVTAERLNLVALTCLYVACKVEENEPKVPSPKKLCSFVENSYTPGDFIQFEPVLLNFFGWYVTIPTAATFLEFFTLHSLQMDDFVHSADANAMTEAHFAERKNELIKSSLVYLDVSLSYHKMSNVKPSLLAAACVAAARFQTPNVRAWNNHLTGITGYSCEQIFDTCSLLVYNLKPLLLAPVSKTFPSKRFIADLGYLSDPEDSDDSETVYSTSPSEAGCSYTSPVSYSSVERSKKRSYTSLSCSSTSSSDSEETCAKKQKVSFDLM